MNTATARHPASEGWRSARAILGDTTRPQMPQPLLLTPANDPRADASKKVVPLRNLKPARQPREATPCGFGTCALDPACTGNCRYREADEALRGHYHTRHTQRAPMPEVTSPSKVDHNARRWTVIFLTAWCVGWLVAAAWWAFA